MTADPAAVAAELAIRRTIAAYCQTCDDGRFGEFGECFTADAVLTVLGQEQRGRDAIVAWIAAAMPTERRGKHVTANPLITVESATAARANTDFMFLAFTDSGPRISAAGRYLDALTRSDDRWLFARREIVLQGRPRQ